MKDIYLGSQKTIRVQQPIDYTVSSVKLIQTIDNGISVLGIVEVEGHRLELTLWEGQAYTNIAQWTDSDVETRIKELLV